MKGVSKIRLYKIETFDLKKWFTAKALTKIALQLCNDSSGIRTIY